MEALAFLLVVALAFFVLRARLAQRSRPQARLEPNEAPVPGQDQTRTEVSAAVSANRRAELATELAATILPQVPETGPDQTGGEGGQGRPAIARTLEEEAPVIFDTDLDDEISFEPDPSWVLEMTNIDREMAQVLGLEHEMAGELTSHDDEGWLSGEQWDEYEFDWSLLHEEIPLPSSYEEDIVMALVRNPRSVYVYWDRSGDGEENLEAMLGEEQWKTTVPCLRVYDLTTGAYPGLPNGRIWTIPLGEYDDHWFIHDIVEPGKQYVFSFERMLPDGRFFTIAQSTPVLMPFDAPAPEAMGRMLYQLFGRPGEQHVPGSLWRLID